MFITVADLGKGPGGTRSPLPLILGEKVRIAEGRKAGRAGQATKNRTPPLAQGLDPPLQYISKISPLSQVNCKTAHLHVNFRSFSECENISLLRILFSIRAQFAMFITVADLGKGPGGTRSPLPLILGEKVRIAEGRKAGRAGQATKNRTPPLAQGLDPPLQYISKISPLSQVKLITRRMKSASSCAQN